MRALCSAYSLDYGSRLRHSKGDLLRSLLPTQRGTLVLLPAKRRRKRSTRSAFFVNEGDYYPIRMRGVHMLHSTTLWRAMLFLSILPADFPCRLLSFCGPSPSP